METKVVQREGYIGELQTIGGWMVRCRLCGIWSPKVKGERGYLCPICGAENCS
jgi:rRNA maturation endonuclease Nob1